MLAVWLTDVFERGYSRGLTVFTKSNQKSNASSLPLSLPRGFRVPTQPDIHNPPCMQDFRTRIDPPKWGLTVLGGVESILEPHEVRRSPPARSISPSVAWFLDFTPLGSLSLRHFFRAVPGSQAARRADARDDYLRRQGRGLPTFMRPGFGAAGAGSSSAAAPAEDDGGSSTPSEFPGRTCPSPPPACNDVSK